MSKRIRVCAKCLRPVSLSYFVVAIGATCSKHGRMDLEDTVKVPQEKANYEATDDY